MCKKQFKVVRECNYKKYFFTFLTLLLSALFLISCGGGGGGGDGGGGDGGGGDNVGGVGPNVLVSEGTVSSPIVIDFTKDIPYSGQVNTTESFYNISSVTAGTSYNITISSLSDDIDLFVYRDAVFSSLLCSSELNGTINESCTAIPTGKSIYINVDGRFTLAGTAFTLEIF
ncbi:MAG: hypothetical protein OEV42_04890 [Deltaproteobacteria bacterium]|nr:hypothetical protein [Deltaproteobacteria bacterium]